MSRQLRLYKLGKVREKRQSFRRNVKSLRVKFRQDIIAIRRSNLSRSLKRIYFKRIRNNFIKQFSNLRSVYRKEIRAIWKLSSIPGSNPTPAPAPTPAPTPVINPSKKALLFGLNYINTSNELRGCINDVNNIGDYLKSKSYSITKLTDYTNPKPTRATIISELTNFLQKGKEGDKLFFHYSGHGSKLRDNNNDENDNQDETLEGLDDKSVLDDELKDIIVNNLKPGVELIALIDACHSGTMLDLKYQYLNDDNSETVINNNIETNGTVYMIGGSKDYQFSMDAFIEGKWQGALSWAFKKTISTNTNVTWKELIEKMRSLLNQNGFTQITQFASGKPMSVENKINL
jgi:hypothetical protein